MEIPRRRGGAYEPRSVGGNILAPTSTPHHAAELRITPSSRFTGAPATSSRPPWATELDSEETPGPSARPPSASRNRPSPQPVGARDFGFAAQDPSPAPRSTGPAGSSSWDDPSGPWPAHNPAGARVQPGNPSASAPPVDQLDLWTQLQHHHMPNRQQSQMQPPGGHQRGDGIFAHIEHSEDMVNPGSPTAGAAALGRGGAPGPAAVAGRRAVGAKTAATASTAPARNGPTGAQRLQGGELSSADARSIGATAAAATPVRRAAVGSGTGAGSTTGSTASAPRVGASPARSRAAGGALPPRPAGDALGPARDAPPRATSTPKPRPTPVPKRSTSITDNVRHDWVDAVSPMDRRAPGGPRSGSAGNDTGGATRWDTDPDGSDRGSWLFVGDASSQHELQRQGPPERPISAGRGSGSGSRASGGADSRPAARRPRPQSPPILGSGGGGGGEGGGGGSESGFEATLSPPVVAVSGGATGGGGGGAMCLGHGVTSGSGGIGNRGGARQQSSTATQAESARQVQALQEENARLRDQVEHLQRLLAASPGQASGLGAGADAVAAPGGRRGSTSARPSSAASGAAGFTDGAPPSLAAAAAAGVTLQQYKSQVIQLQRQVALMSREIEAKSRLGFEAEGVLLEMASRLEDLAASTSAGAAGADGGGEEEPLRREQLLQLHKWSKQMLGRLRSEKSQSSRLFTQQAQESRAAAPWSAPHGGGMAGGGSGGDTAGPAPAWVVPFIPAGGNRFLLASATAAADDLAGAAGGGGGAAAAGSGAGGGPSVAGIACGHGVLLADPLLAHRLELQAAALAPKLAAVAVLLKTQVLPVMPWLGLEAADRLQAEVGEAAEGVARCAESLVSLCSLLPAGAAVFGDGPVADEPKRRAAEVEAGRDSWLYGTPGLAEAPEPPSPVVAEDGVANLTRLQAAIAPLLRDRKAGTKALADILEPLRAKTQSAASKRALLELELRFAARASALHAEHVSHLMMSVGIALEECRGAKDAAAIKAYFSAAAAVRQVLEAADALELHPCENCLKALVDEIRAHRDSLDRLPDLLTNAPAADVEGRLLSKIEDLHQGFKKAISRLEAHKRRHQDLLAGRTAADPEDEDDVDGGGGDGSGRGDSDEEGGGPNGTVAGGAARRPSPGASGAQPRQLTQQRQTGAGAGAGSGAGNTGSARKPPNKPPRPRAEWQD